MKKDSSEHILEKIGSFGLYQLRIFVILNYATFFYATGVTVITFSTAEPPWRCKANSTSCTLNGTFKVGDKDYEHRCSIPRKDWEFAVEGDFDSIVTEWDLVCERAVQVSLANSLPFFLGVVGSLTSSILSDKYGRKPVVLFIHIYVYCCGLLSAFAQTYWVYAVFRILLGLGIGCTTVVFSLIMEYTGVRHRSVVGITYWTSYALGLCTLALLGYFVRSWRVLVIITSAPGLLFVLFWWWIPESFRWLLMKGKIDEAKKTLKTAARVNKRLISDEDLEDLKLFRVDDLEEKVRLGDIRDLFASCSMAQKTVFSWYFWFVNGLVFYAITLSASTLGGNMYLNFFLSALCDLMAIVVGIPIFKRFGRKKPIILNLWIAVLFLIIAALLSYYDDGSEGFLVGKTLSAFFFAKLFITVAFSGVFIHSSELFPTVIRNTAMGLFGSAIGLGSACSSYIIFSQRVHPLMPYGIMAAFVSVCGITFATLPETNKKAMPDTIKQADLIIQESSSVDADDDPTNQQL